MKRIEDAENPFRASRVPKENTGIRYSIFFGKYLPVTKLVRMTGLTTGEN